MKFRNTGIQIAKCIKKDCDNEGTETPWWVIIDPKQNFETNDRGVNNIADMITGPFFSRQTAQQYLDVKRYNFGKNAVVYCMSGYASSDYKKAYDLSCDLTGIER